MKRADIIHLKTKEGQSLTGKEYNLYPRPQLARDSFFSLNGKWDLYVSDTEKYEILVPYPPESILSGVGKVFCDGTKLIYTKKFTLPEGFLKDRVILNLGAVDQIATVYINGKFVGEHVGGYNSFSFDITEYLDSENEIKIEVTDTLKGYVLPYGKQTLKRGGMWYTRVSGIWQSVWLESVPDEYIRSLKIDVGLDFAKIKFEGAKDGTVTVLTPEGDIKFPIENGTCNIKIENPKNWTPSEPYLYYFQAKCGQDSIKSYFALRTLEIKTIDTYPRLCLNGKPFFFHALLDQGYFSDGIYTPASPSLYKSDIMKMKELGFNTLRKHIKVEPEWFYYDCDRLGMVVFQDMVNNGKYSFFRDTALPTIGFKNISERFMKRTSEQKIAFERAMKETVNQLYNHPCICYYTIFNEGWGQFESERMYKALRELDSSRFIDTNSGWFGKHTSDVCSLHVYFKKFKIKKSNLPIVLSEFGGYSYKVKDHVANLKDTYGYKKLSEQAEFENALFELYENEIIPSIKKGLCASVYTQLSDVEDETNGLLTYDRAILKVSKEKMLDLASKLTIEEQQ